MSQAPSRKAWNNFVLAEATDCDAAVELQAAWLAKHYMNCVSNGGINSFLTNSWELDALEVVEALQLLGAAEASKELAFVLTQLATPLSVSSQDQRWQELEDCWSTSLDQADFLSPEAEKELMQRLEDHVAKYRIFYEELE